MTRGLEVRLGEYAEAFDASDAGRLASFFHCPCWRVSPDVAVPLRTLDAIRANVEGPCWPTTAAQGLGRASVAAPTAEFPAAPWKILVSTAHADDA